LRELELWIVEEIQKYHHTQHDGLHGETPAMAWCRLFKDEQGKPTFPPMVGDPRSFYIGFLPSEERLVQTSGVSIGGVRYWDSSLTPFIKTGVKRTFHYDQRDMSKIYLDDGNGYIDIPVIDRSIGAFSAYELKAARSEVRKAGGARASTKMLFEAVARQREIEEEAVTKSKAARVSQAKRAPRSERSAATTKESIDYSEVPTLIDISWEDFQ
jgi:putative transposase